MRAKRRNIELELAWEPEAKGEARSAGAQGTEARGARAEPERPAAEQGPSMEAVAEPGNLKKALARVRRNKGAPGIDGMRVDDLGDHLKDHWTEIKSRLLDGSYTPQPVRRVEIPKVSGGVRPLGWSARPPRGRRREGRSRPCCRGGRASVTRFLARLKAQVRERTRCTKSVSLTHLVTELSRYLVGWRGYFGFSETPSVLRSIDQWIRRRQGLGGPDRRDRLRPVADQQ